MNQFKLFGRQGSQRFLKYISVGVTAFIVEFGSFIILVQIFREPNQLVLLQSFSFLTGLAVSFAGSRFITFKANKRNFVHTGRTQIIAYLIIALVNLIFTNIIIHTLVYLGVGLFIAKIGVMGLVVLWNYMIFNKFIFNSSSKAR